MQSDLSGVLIRKEKVFFGNIFLTSELFIKLCYLYLIKFLSFASIIAKRSIISSQNKVRERRKKEKEEEKKKEKE